MKKLTTFSACLVLAILVAVSTLPPPSASARSAAQSPALGASQAPQQSWSANIDDIRHVAKMMPGQRPLRINMLKFAESRRTKNFSVQGAPADPSIQARTVFQLMYRDGYVMIDSGMDQQLHNFFGRGVVEPYFADAFKEVERALRGARSIVMTHEHGDHVGGVVRGPLAAQLAPKTILTRTQAEELINHPQMPEIKLTPAQAAHYNIIDYDQYMPYGPGVALIKAPGHTPGSQMVYVLLDSGREYILVGDAAWHMDGVREIKGKEAPWITENTDQVMAQLRWLNELSRTEPNLVIVASHDDDEHKELIARKLLGGKLE
jgi:glyoxylase-like metal-dependent hydrolase (beta-lactamase superfamily II)